MILVSLAALKLALGVTGTAEDSALTNAEARAAAWVETQTGRRFQSPSERIEYHRSVRGNVIYLDGHIADPGATVAVRERQMGGLAGDWATFTGFERRNDTIVLTAPGFYRPYPGAWYLDNEYEVTYDDGYNAAPSDIQELVIELVSRDRLMTRNFIESETIGEYSYRLSSSAIGSSGLALAGSATLDAWRRVRV